MLAPGYRDHLAPIRAEIAGEELAPERDELLDSATLPPALPAGALCVCGVRWRWDGHKDQEVAFSAWSSRHVAVAG